MTRQSRAYGRLLVVSLLLLPSLAWADPEIWLVIGPIEPPTGTAAFASSGDAYWPEADAILLREGVVTPMPACDAMLTLGIRSSAEPPSSEEMLLRLLKKRATSGCTLEVLEVGTGRRRADGPDASEPGTSGTSNLPPSNGVRRIDARTLPCGSQLIQVREGRMGGSSSTVQGTGPSGDCEGWHDMHGPLGFRWLSRPPAGAPPPS